jgi:hypothetical protein
MKTAFFFLSLISVCAYSQQVKQLQFKEETHDFGVISEHKGPVTHEFVFSNSSSRPVTILNVQASCGCTTPGWSKEPIPAGQNGFIQASFDPKGRPGAFNKTLTVTTDLDGGPVVLQIKGQVSADSEEHVDEMGFTVAKGSISLKSGAFNMGKVFFKDEYSVREFPFVNKGSGPIIFDPKVISPKHIRVEVVPSTVAAGAKGVIRLSYNGQLKGQYGFQSDNVELHSNDANEPTKSFTVLATIEDFFPQLSDADLAKAPQLRVGSYSLDFGRVRPNTEVVREIQITNAGKKQLDIKSIQGNCTCINASAGKTSLKPGESSTIKVAFDPQERRGSNQKAVTVYSNDPRNPVQRITFTAYIE